jgi:ethanolamine utilization microcompartment shell protein EutS
MDWMIGFIDTLYTPLLITGNYSAIANLRTLQFTVTHTLGFSFCSSRILATDFNTVVIPVSL